MSKFAISIIVLLMLGMISGCSVGPDYVKPKVCMPNQYKEVPAGWKLAEPADNLDKGSWWHVFNDQYLNLLMDQVDISNQNIIAAVAQYKSAVATLDQTKSAYWPNVTLDVSATRQKNATGTEGLNNNSSIYNNYTINPNLTWYPDLFGAIRRAVEASAAGAQATKAQLADTKLSMQALLAQTYYQLRAADLNQKFLDDTVISYRRTLEITKNKYAAGIVSLLDIAQAETQLQNAQTAALDNGINRAQYEHAIAVLIGRAPENFAIKPQYTELPIPQIPLEIPSMLLERRADIAAAERSVAQASAQIGVAVAAYFPTVTLTSNYGFSSNHFKQIFSYPANVWSFGAALAQTIFDGGSIAAQERVARATFEQKVAAYKQTVLSALQEVDDYLASVRILDAEAKIQDAAVASAYKAVDITMNQYNSGIVDYTSVVVEQAIAYNAKSSAIQIYGRRLVAVVGLIQSLGGGWDARDLNKR